jgi:hypothetical protein
MTLVATKYLGDDATRRLLLRYGCPTPFHVVRMRYWGEIVSPSLPKYPIRIIESLWPGGLPTFGSPDEAAAFFQAMFGLWNHLAEFRTGTPPIKLQKPGSIASRRGLYVAAKTRVEELNKGFMRGFTGGKRKMDVSTGVAELLSRIEKGIELLATARNTFVRPPGPEDAGVQAEFRTIFPRIDRALHDDLNAIATAVHRWEMQQSYRQRKPTVEYRVLSDSGAVSCLGDRSGGRTRPN